MIFKEEYIKAVSEIVKMTVIPIFLIFAFWLFKGYIPGINDLIFEDRTTVSILINAAIALASFSFLVICFKPIFTVIYYYLGKFKDDPDLVKAVKLALLLVYIFLAYFILARRGYPESVFGAPITFLYQITNGNIEGIYNFFSKIFIVVIIGGSIFASLYLWKALTPIVDQQIQATFNKTEKQDLSDSSNKCSHCGQEINSEVKFCPHCGGKITEKVS